MLKHNTYKVNKAHYVLQVKRTVEHTHTHTEWKCFHSEDIVSLTIIR